MASNRYLPVVQNSGAGFAVIANATNATFTNLGPASDVAITVSSPTNPAGSVTSQVATVTVRWIPAAGHCFAGQRRWQPLMAPVSMS